MKNLGWKNENLKKLNRNSRTIRYSNQIRKLMCGFNSMLDITEERSSNLKDRLEENNPE